MNIHLLCNGFQLFEELSCKFTLYEIIPFVHKYLLVKLFNLTVQASHPPIHRTLPPLLQDIGDHLVLRTVKPHHELSLTISPHLNQPRQSLQLDMLACRVGFLAIKARNLVAV